MNDNRSCDLVNNRNNLKKLDIILQLDFQVVKSYKRSTLLDISSHLHDLTLLSNYKVHDYEVHTNNENILTRESFPERIGKVHS
jgi:hypothetical protein